VHKVIPESEIAIEVNDLTKSFGSGENRVDAVKGISLKVRKGEISIMKGHIQAYKPQN